jgi:hydroxyacylglutathione hydrolase
MILKQYYLACLSHASYLIGDEASGEAAVVDPQRDVDQYVADAAARGLRITHVVLTHFHADFVSGHVELRERVGAEIVLGARAAADYRFRAVKDGERIDLGGVRLTFLETPGHTPESVCVTVTDLAANAREPHAVLTGDTLFVGDVGRPDLLASVGMTADALAGALYDSVHQKLMSLPDATLVYPAHGAGSMCGKALGKETFTTIGAQRATNYAVRARSKEEFTRLVACDQSECPAYFAYDADLNRRERPSLERTLEGALRPMSLDEVLRAKNAGAQILDVRDADAYWAGHLPGSINIGLGGKYATWAGTVFDRNASIVLVAPPGGEREAAMRLGRIGFDRVVGFLKDGPRAFEGRTDLVRRAARVAIPDLKAALASATPPLVVDVRNQAERDEKRIEPSLHVPLNRLAERMAEVPRDRRLVVHCAGGYRSSIAASMLANAGYREVSDLIGGFAEWERYASPRSGAPA